jgi:PAS domain-containing protein
LYLAQLFRSNPLMALALLVCLATILWCIFLTRRQRNSLDKLLTGLLGLIAIYQALRILGDSGLVRLTGIGRVDGWVDFISACLYLAAAVILKISSIDRATTKVHLRLVEADEKPVDLTKGPMAAVPELGHPLVDASPLATFAFDLHGTVIYWNTAAESLTGWTRDELIGQPLPFPHGGRVLCKNGSPVEAAVWTSPLRSANGAPRGTLVIAAGSDALKEAGLSVPGTPARVQLALQY